MASDRVKTASIELTGGPAGAYRVVRELPDGHLEVAPVPMMERVYARHGVRPATEAEVDEHFGDLPIAPND